ncbi:MAG TPA: DNA polymerase III subunit epsilon [Sphingomonas sp.]|jgi:DNA polymerase-3 subunit epsilon
MVDHDDERRPADAGAAAAHSRRTRIETGPTGRGDRSAASVGVALAIRTAGHALEGAIFDLALRRFTYDAAGVITAIDKPYSWLEDPGRPIPEDFARLAGVGDADVAGKRIDDALAWYLIRSAGLIVTYGAEITRPAVEARLPDTLNRAWACIREEIGWRTRGTPVEACASASGAGVLAGPGRRASDDVDADLSLLAQVFDDGRTALSLLLEHAMCPSWNVRAWGAPAAAVEALRLAGYCWNVEERVWMKHVFDREREAAWLAEHIYRGVRADDARPSWATLSRYTRYS